MATVVYGVRELQAKIGAALRAVAGGARVVITSRGKPVAALVKADTRLPGEDRVERKLRRMAAEGRIRLGKARTGPLPSRTFPGLGGVVAQLLRDRR